MNDYDTPEIRCSLWNLSRVTECPITQPLSFGSHFRAVSVS